MVKAVAITPLPSVHEMVRESVDEKGLTDTLSPAGKREWIIHYF